MTKASQLRVMVVDDQKSVRALIRGSLAALGCASVTECADGLEALEHIRHNPVQLIISDLNMPRMDGLALLEAVRADPELRKIGFIMLTGRGEVELVRRAIALGVNNYLVKPFAIATLKAKMEAVVGPLE